MNLASFSKRSINLLIKPCYAMVAIKPHRDALGKLRQDIQEQNKEDNFDNYKKSIFAFLKKEQAIKVEDKHLYNDKIVFNNKLNKATMKLTAYGQLGLTPLFGYLSYQIYLNMHPILFSLSLTLFCGQYLSMKRAHGYLSSIVYKVVYQDQKVLLFKLSGKTKIISTTVNDIVLKDVINNEETYRENSQDSIDIQSFIITIDVKDSKEQQWNDLKLLVEPGMSEIGNMDMFRAIIYGDQEEVDNFYFVEKQVQYSDDEE